MPQDPHDPSAYGSYSIAGTDLADVLTINGLYQVPVGKGKSLATGNRFFESVANQILFYRLRHAYEKSPQTGSAITTRMVAIAREEIELARRQYAIAKQDSEIAFEASNHYYYRPLDLAEKVLNCHDVIKTINSG